MMTRSTLLRVVGSTAAMAMRSRIAGYAAGWWFRCSLSTSYRRAIWTMGCRGGRSNWKIGREGERDGLRKSRCGG